MARVRATVVRPGRFDSHRPSSGVSLSAYRLVKTIPVNWFAPPADGAFSTQRLLADVATKGAIGWVGFPGTNSVRLGEGGFCSHLRYPTRGPRAFNALRKSECEFGSLRRARTSFELGSARPPDMVRGVSLRISGASLPHPRPPGDTRTPGLAKPDGSGLQRGPETGNRRSQSWSTGPYSANARHRVLAILLVLTDTTSLRNRGSRVSSSIEWAYRRPAFSLTGIDCPANYATPVAGPEDVTRVSMSSFNVSGQPGLASDSITLTAN